MTLFLLFAVIALMAAAGVALEVGFRLVLWSIRGARVGLQAAQAGADASRQALQGLNRRLSGERAYA